MMNPERLTIRIGKDSLAFAAESASAKERIVFEPFALNNSMSIEANLRTAFETSPMLAHGYQNVQTLVSTPVMLVPIDEYNEEQAPELYRHIFTDHEGKQILPSVLPELHAVALFAVSKDLLTVLQDHFQDVRIMPAVQPVWKHLHQRSFTGARNKLYAYFHDHQTDVFCFNKSRFKFHNTFPATHAADAMYFILNVWKQLGLNAEADELHVVGDLPQKEWLSEQLHRYVQRTYIISAAADFHRAAATLQEGIPYDLLALFLDD